VFIPVSSFQRWFFIVWFTAELGATPNKSLDRSGGSPFRKLILPAVLESIRAARSTQPLYASHSADDMSMSNHISVVVCVLILCFPIKSITINPAEALSIDTPLPTKFDEYGLISFVEEKRRLGRFARELQRKLQTTSHIIVYGQHKSEVDARIRRIKNYLIKKWALNQFRVTTESALCRKNTTTELWIIPPGTVAPSPSGSDQTPCKAKSNESGKFVSYRRAQQALGADSP